MAHATLDKAKSALRRISDDQKIPGGHRESLREIGEALGEAEARLIGLEIIVRGLVKKSGLTIQDVKRPAVVGADEVNALLRG